MPISDRFSAKSAFRSRLLALAPVTCLLLVAPAWAQSPARVQSEVQRRAGQAAEAHELLTKGDESYQAGKWAAAVAAYDGARDLLGEAPATSDLRKAATERLVQASIELAREKRRLGDPAGANAAIKKVLAADVAPNHALALAVEEEINDPIRTNPAGSAEHTRDVEEVRFALYKAEGFYNLGDFDQARRVYEEVLRIDPYNKAARRGMEQTENQRAGYGRAAYDQARAEMLAEVDGGWELRVRPTDDIPESLPTGAIGDAGRVLISNKLEKIILPQVAFDQVSIRDAIDFLSQQSVQLDTLELNPADRGINFVLELGSAEIAAPILDTKFDLFLKQVPLGEVLKHICELTRTNYSAQQFAVIIRPAGVASNDLVSRTFQVPPDFLTTAGNAAGASTSAKAADDPFAASNAGEALLVRRMTAREVLEAQGVPFPEGASANFNPAGNTLVVRNTSGNMDLVEDLVTAIASSQPVQVMTEVRMIRTKVTRLKELGWDVLLDEFSLGGTGLTPGVQALTLSGGADDPANLADIALPNIFAKRRGITSGNRSGTEGIASDSIDALILQQQQGFARGQTRAPGALWVNGVLNEANVTLLMRALDQKKNVDMVVAPSTVSRNGQQSTVEVIRELIYPTEYEPPELPNTISGGVSIDFDTGELFGGNAMSMPVTPATPTSFEMRKVGVTLDVVPTVSEDLNYVDLKLKPSVTDFDGFINYGSPITSPSTDITGNATSTVVTPNEILMPVFSVMRTENDMTIRTGQTVVIGGMFQEKVQKVQDKTPVLGEIPGIGRFFQSEIDAPEQTAILFFVTVKVMDSGGQPLGQ